MKSRETLLRLKRFQVNEKRRRVGQIEAMIAEFERMAGDLDREIAAEESRAGHSDPSHFAYPTYAKAAMQRRDNLRRSTGELRLQLDEAQTALLGAIEELKKAEIMDDREHGRDRAAETAKDQPDSNRASPARIARAQV